MAVSNKRLQLTMRKFLVGRPASRASVIYSRLAAEARRSTDIAKMLPTESGS